MFKKILAFASIVETATGVALMVHSRFVVGLLVVWTRRTKVQP